MRLLLAVSFVGIARAGGDEILLGRSTDAPFQLSTNYSEFEFSSTLIAEGAQAAVASVRGPCCDDLDCSPSSPAYAGECEKLFTCEGVWCPAEPKDQLARRLLGFQEAGDDCKVC